MYLAYDVGGTFIKHALINENGDIQQKGKAPTPYEGEDLLDQFISILVNIYKDYKVENHIEGICVSLPGQIDVENGIVYGGGALTYLDEVHLGKLLQDKCDGINVALENDAKCAALAEAWVGNAKGCKTAVVIVFGTSIGGGIILDGKVHHGQDLVAGEVSMCLDNIQIDDLPMNIPKSLWHNKVSLICLRKTIAKYKGLDYKDVGGEQIYEWANAGDQYINALLENIYLSIAKQICNIYLILAPEVILIGGGISSRPEFLDGVKRYVNQVKKFSKTNVFRNIKVDTCKYMNDSNLIGAFYNYKLLYEV